MRRRIPISEELTFEDGSMYGRVSFAVVKRLSTNLPGRGLLDNLIDTCIRANSKGYLREVNNALHRIFVNPSPPIPLRVLCYDCRRITTATNGFSPRRCSRWIRRGMLDLVNSMCCQGSNNRRFCGRHVERRVIEHRRLLLRDARP